MMLNDLMNRLNGNKCKNPPSVDREYAVKFMRLAEIADKFYFGELPLESAEDKEGGYRLPEVTNDEREWWFTGLIPLPGPICWYEFKLNGVASGILIRTSDDGRIWATRAEPNMIDDVWGSWVNSESGKEYAIEAAKSTLNMISKLPKDEFDKIWGTSVPLMVYLTLMINSKTSEISKVQPSAAQNRLRRQLNKTPLFSHTIVTIVPQRFIREAEIEGEKHGSPKRLHWRRSHLRIYHRGQPNELKIVIARCLVGRRELGEVTHDYIVKLPLNGEIQHGANS